MRYLYTLLILLSSGLSFGQSQTIKGKVTAPSVENPKVIEPLIGANIIWLNTTSGVSTNSKGEFEIERIAGVDTLVISFIGYGSEQVYAGNQSYFDIELIPGEAIGSADVVEERRTTEISLLDPLNAQTLSEQELCKAACCNLSESFETNASIDASFTDAVTGTRQIKMLGLDGKYAQISKDNMADIRGLSTIYGLSFIPGAWINEIFISKGAGSVVNGYESITGEINVDMKDGDNAEKLYINAYANEGGRTELNANVTTKVGDHWSTALLTHGEFNNTRMDRNGDGFLDNPLKKDYIVRNEWTYRGDHGINGEYSFTGMESQTTSGQFNFDPKDATSVDLWGADIYKSHLEATAKTGYVFKGQDWKSFGSQFKGLLHRQASSFGHVPYIGEQQYFKANLLYATRIKNDQNKIVTGFSYMYDGYNESLADTSFQRIERVPGVFAEYTLNKLERFTLIAGARIDQHNEFGTFFSPRMHFRYSVTENASIKLAAGKGYRTANVIMDNVGLLASSRDWVIAGDASRSGFGLKPEEAWNFGINYSHKFRLNYRDASLSLDFYRTEFVNQVVTDMDVSARSVHFYNIEGQSFSNSAQAEFTWSPVKRVDVRLAYRWLDVQTKYQEGWLQKPLNANHRAFMNVAYETRKNDKEAQWKFDATTQWIGEQRMPTTADNPEALQRSSMSQDYVLLNAQVTRVFSKGFEVYLGGENLTNFKQPNPIIDAENPFGEYFDASLIYGPVFGKMIYAGLRYKIF